ncbi:MAG: archease [Candidatus Micrarchaeota archaeon]|nr:archease [Candidatus Micrarchaeota archaeon]
MPYRYIDELTSADVAFEAEGKTIEEMFSEAGIALLGVMVRKPEKIEPKIMKKIEKEAENEERLLFLFLDELIFLKDVEQMFFSKFNVKIKRENGLLKLIAEAYGEKINPKKHEIVIDAKAVTMHHFKVEKAKGGWKCQVIIDV